MSTSAKKLHAEPTSKPLIVYFHHYPPEVEARQYSGMRLLVDRLMEKYRVLYVGFRGAVPADPDVRRGMELLELPGSINIASAADKLQKTAWFYLLMPWLLWRLRRMRPALILCKEPLPLILTLVCFSGIPVLIDSVTDWWWRILLGWCAPGRKIAAFLEKYEARIWNHRGAWVVALNNEEATMLVERGMEAKRLRVIHTAMDYRYYPCDSRHIRQELGYGGDLWVAAIHGTIRPGKGYAQLLGWWKRLAGMHPNWRLLIIGGAGGLAWCRRLVRRLDVEGSVKLTGWLPTHEDVNRHLNAADCLLAVRANSEDNRAMIPSVLYHSMAIGKPTVATGLPGMAEVVRHGVDGFLYTPDDFESFRAALEFVALNPEEAAHIGRAGIARARECFDPAIAADLHLKMIADLLGSLDA